MKIKNSFKVLLLTFVLIFTLMFNVFAGGSYIEDKAGVLSSSTVSSANSNFEKLEANSGAKAKIYVLKDLGGKNIDDIAASYAKDISGNKYAIFVVSLKEHKNKFIVGSGLNNAINKSEVDRIASLPNSYFKDNRFDDGVLKVGEAIDKDITSVAVKVGDATVKSNGYSTTVAPKKSSNFGKILLYIFLAIVVAVIIYAIYRYIKNKNERDLEDFKRRNDIDKEDNGYKTSNLKSETSYSKSSYSKREYEDDDYEPSYSSSHSHHSSHSSHSSHRSSSPSHTTVVNNHYDSRSGSDFVEGMVIGSMLNESTHHHDHHDDYHSSSNNNSYSSPSSSSYEAPTSGDWGSSSSSWSDSSSSSYDSGSSSWDSGSSYDSGSGSSDW